jgi:hypothetical protein
VKVGHFCSIFVFVKTRHRFRREHLLPRAARVAHDFLRCGVTGDRRDFVFAGAVLGKTRGSGLRP